ncbi:MAG: hypothetical protein KDD76_01255 [Rickettsiales bacterium]|nr:hypothetical protein [Rickettsiales bacterium]
MLDVSLHVAEAADDRPLFRMDNGVEGAGRVERTPTGFKSVVHGYGTHEEVWMEIKREVDLEGTPYLEIEFSSFDEDARLKMVRTLEDMLRAKGHTDGSLPNGSSKTHYMKHTQGMSFWATQGDPMTPFVKAIGD